ncbi:MAG: hypothetical protein ACFB5Z_18585, partial [Elainellaceae cyanobacterium]
MCGEVPERCTPSHIDAFEDIEPHATALVEAGTESIEPYQALQCYYLGRGLYRQAFQWAERAIAFSIATSGPDSEQTAYFHKQAGERALLAGMAGEALGHLEQAYGILEGRPASELLANVLIILAAAQRGLGDIDSAEATVEKAIELANQYFSMDSLEMADAKLTLVTTRYVRLRQQGEPSDEDLEALEAQAQEVLELRERHSPEDGSTQAEAINILAKICELREDDDRAVQL